MFGLSLSLGGAWVSIDCFGLGVYLCRGNNKSFMIDF